MPPKACPLVMFNAQWQCMMKEADGTNGAIWCDYEKSHNVRLEAWLHTESTGSEAYDLGGGYVVTFDVVAGFVQVSPNGTRRNVRRVLTVFPERVQLATLNV